MNHTIIISWLVFLLGMYYYINYGESYLENFETQDCPNLLIQKGSKLYLKYTTKAEVPGVNPLEFNNLEEYVEYVEWQRHNQINCPVLFLKREYDTQNNEVYKALPGLGNMISGIESRPSNINTDIRPNMSLNKTGQDPYSELLNTPSHDPPIYNNRYGDKDSEEQSQVDNKPLDKLFLVQEQSSVSDNPMDSNWGGTEYTQKQIDSGKYKETDVASQG